MSVSDRVLNLSKPARRLYELSLYGRWLFVLLCWLMLAPYSVWRLWKDFQLWREHFTWVAVRYAFAFNLIAAFSLFFCIGITGAVLVWQSNHLLRGLSDREKMRLENQARKIQESGSQHPLWKWVCR